MFDINDFPPSFQIIIWTGPSITLVITLTFLLLLKCRGTRMNQLEITDNNDDTTTHMPEGQDPEIEDRNPINDARNVYRSTDMAEAQGTEGEDRNTITDATNNAMTTDMPRTDPERERDQEPENENMKTITEETSNNDNR